MSAASKSLGFVGLGKMGYPMASLLHRAGHELTLFDAVRAQADRFAAGHIGVCVAESLEAFSAVEVVITMLPDSEAVDEIVLGRQPYRGLIHILPPGAAVIDMTSSQPLRSRALAQALGNKGLHFLDAPVSGGVKRAHEGTLTIMVGGDQAQFRERRDLLQCMGKAIVHVGGPGAGHAMKALNNYVSAAGLVATVEALVVGQGFGLDPTVMTDVLNSSTGKNNTTEHKVVQFMLSGAFDSGFSLQLMAKDIGTAMDLGKSLGLNMRLGQQVLGVWSDATTNLEPSADHTEMYRYLQGARK
jgi:3-hydroxyisobutyrate dehydrogenase